MKAVEKQLARILIDEDINFLLIKCFIDFMYDIHIRNLHDSTILYDNLIFVVHTHAEVVFLYKVQIYIIP